MEEEVKRPVGIFLCVALALIVAALWVGLLTAGRVENHCQLEGYGFAGGNVILFVIFAPFNWPLFPVVAATVVLLFLLARLRNVSMVYLLIVTAVALLLAPAAGKSADRHWPNVYLIACHDGL